MTVKKKENISKDLVIIRNHQIRILLDLQYSTICRPLKKFIQSKKKNLRVLDFGSGIAPYKRYFSSKADYYTLDNSYPSDYKNCGEIPSSEKFDLILMVEVLEHISQPNEILKELSTLLKPDGKIFLSVPFNARIHNAPKDYTRWTPLGLKELIEKSNLKVQESYTRGSDLCSISTKLNYFLFTRVKNPIYTPFVIIALIVFAIPLLVASHFSILKNNGQKAIDPLGVIAIASLS